MRNAKKGSKKPPELSIILPCLNEERTVGACVRDARAFLDANCVEGEVIVADNGSMDRSAEVARRNGAVVAHVAEKGPDMEASSAAAKVYRYFATAARRFSRSCAPATNW